MYQSVYFEIRPVENSLQTHENHLRISLLVLPFESNWMFDYQVEIASLSTPPAFFHVFQQCDYAEVGAHLSFPCVVDWVERADTWSWRVLIIEESSVWKYFYTLSSRLPEFFAESSLVLNIQVSPCLLNRKQHQFQTVQNWSELYLAWYYSVIDSCLTSVSYTWLFFPN